MVLYRILGALSGSSIATSSIASSKGNGSLYYTGLDRFVGHKVDTFGRDFEWNDFLKKLSECKLIFLGEIHSVAAITNFQTRIIKHLTPPPPHENSKTNHSRTLHVVMEHFSFDMQDMLDRFAAGDLSFDELNREYHQNGSEGHNIRSYRNLLEHARRHAPSVQLHAGFLSRQYARQLMKEGEDKAIQAAKPYLPSSLTRLAGRTDFHYNFFESLLTGRNVHDQSLRPSDRFGGIFKAQLLKDVAMAHRINGILLDHQEESSSRSDDQIVVIAGNGHVGYYQGVPERVLDQHGEWLVDKTCLVTCHGMESSDQLKILQAEELIGGLELGAAGANPADFLFVYHREEDDDDGKGVDEPETVEQQERQQPELPPLEQYLPTTVRDITGTAESAAKEETRNSYNKVGASAHLPGNELRARAILTYLGYTPGDIAIAGPDAYNYQGVGNPHRHANLAPGETVLDIGSGLGIDSFLAAHKVGPTGKVIGMDLSSTQVAHAQRRTKERSLDETVRFVTADMECMPLPDCCIDVAISNGAFCLAPNKEKAFAEIYRVLKPGGRMVVCTTTIQTSQLDPDEEWPLCMRMFMAKDEIEPLCEGLGFTNLVVDDTDSKMVYEIPITTAVNREEKKEGDEDGALSSLNPERYRVHGNSSEFEHLAKYDMDQLCARVCVVATKPHED